MALPPVAPGMAAMPGMMPGMPGTLGAMMAPPAVVPDNLDEGVEGASGGVGGGLKLTGGARAALMNKLAANAGLDVSNVPQIPLPQAPQQPQVRGAGAGLGRAAWRRLWLVAGHAAQAVNKRA